MGGTGQSEVWWWRWREGGAQLLSIPRTYWLVAAAPERVQTQLDKNNPTINMASRIRQNYKEDCEALVNKQINMELYASYVYMSMVGPLS